MVTIIPTQHSFTASLTAGQQVVVPVYESLIPHAVQVWRTAPTTTLLTDIEIGWLPNGGLAITAWDYSGPALVTWLS